MEHSPGCPHGSTPPERGTFEAAVQAAVYAFLGEVGAPSGSVVTICARLHELDDCQDVITYLEIGVGPHAQDQMAAEHARDELERTGGAPWLN